MELRSEGPDTFPMRHSERNDANNDIIDAGLHELRPESDRIFARTATRNRFTDPAILQPPHPSVANWY